MTNSKIKIFVINLKKSIERRKSIMKLMNEHSLEFEFFEAIDGLLLPDNFVTKSRNRSNKWYRQDEGDDKSMRLAEIGVAVSHYKIYQRILNEKIDFAIVMEDDASFDKRFAYFLTQLKNIRKVLKKFDLILLGYCTHDVKYNLPAAYSYWGRMRVGRKFKVGIPLKWYWSAIGYVISLRGALLLSEKQGEYPCVTADILTANSPMYGVRLGILNKPIIWPGEHSKISTIQIQPEKKLPVNLPSISSSKEEGFYKNVLKIIRSIKNILRKEKMKMNKKQYLFTLDKY
jgi:GR25 family glycosyltransferase involved in LPS biosynthesis